MGICGYLWVFVICPDKNHATVQLPMEDDRAGEAGHTLRVTTASSTPGEGWPCTSQKGEAT